MGSRFIDGGARRGEPIPLREHRRSAPRVLTVPTELTTGCLLGGSAPPNGSRLSCGRLGRRRKGVRRQSVPARAQHSVSLKAIIARQLQALVRRHLPQHSRPTSATAKHPRGNKCACHLQQVAPCKRPLQRSPLTRPCPRRTSTSLAQ